MNRKDFFKKAGLATAGGLAAPYILPSGRLFGRTNTPKAEYVVLVMFAGGVRQQESVLKRYLEDSQEVSGASGNIMPNIFNGGFPTKKVVFGTDLPGNPKGSEPIPRILSSSLEQTGTIFNEVNAQSAGHYVGLNTLVTGSTGTAQGLKVRPRYPTIFEYLRRHAGFKATDTWFIANTIGNSTPLLNCSNNAEYGLQYGGNMFAAPVTFGSMGREILGNGKPYSRTDLEPMYFMKNFLDQSFGLTADQMMSIKNTDEERTIIKEFIRTVFQRQTAGQIVKPPVTDNGDAVNISYAAEVLRYFKPKMLAVNMSSVDGCHSNFTGYLRSLHRADHAVGWLWNYIQNNIPEMSGKTIMIIAPECGRNLNPNPILDENDWYAFDHSDSNSLRVWAAMAGKNVPNLSVGGPGNTVGRLTDIVPTIADIFGIYDEVMASPYIDPLAKSLFLRM
ncbi:MAG: hypothetical protein JNL57_06685 [Bacteroidetes bacterium]|nr:hypothetical protein [Bacteroidota bacterium]